MERQSTRKLFKLVIALVALFTLALSVFAFGACGGEEHKHVYESTGKTAANCGKIGVETFTCSCGDTYVAVTPATGSHSWGADGYCQTCGLPNFGAEGIDYSKIPDSFTAEDLDAIKAAITASKGELTKEQQAAHDALGETLEDLQGSVGDLQDAVSGLVTHPLHTFEKKGAVKTLTLPGSCTTYGVKFTLSTCDICGATFLTNIEKDGTLGHTSDGGKVAVEPTCTLFGSWQETCTVCGEVINERTLNTVAHEKGDKSETESVPATCTQTGIDKFECKWCHKVQPEFNVVTDALGHLGQPAHADCEAEETYTWICPRCEEEAVHTYKAGEHTWKQEGEPVITDCTSTTGKSTTYKCSVCGKEKVEKTAADGQHPAHSTETIIEIYVPYESWETYKSKNPDAKDPVNYAEGSNGYDPDNNVVHYTYYKCATCGQRIMNTSEAEHHTFRVNQNYKPTGADKTWKELGHTVDMYGNPVPECLDYSVHYDCLDTGCEACYDDTVTGLKHDWSAEDWDDESAGVGRPSAGWIYKRLPSCSQEGEAYRYCKRCNADADGNFDKTKTCGYETHPVSTVPHRINKNADNYEYLAPTCEVNGHEEGDCIVCGEFQQNVLKATGHNYKYAEDAVETWDRVYGNDDRFPCRSTLAKNPCLNEGCKHALTHSIDPEAKHQAARVMKKNTMPTCTTPGEVTWICDACLQTWSEAVPALGHELASDVWGIPAARGEDPTCTEDGWYEAYCERCGETIGERVVVPATGHTWSETFEAKQAATCTEDGWQAHVCTVCGYVATAEDEGHFEVLEATGHTVAGQRVGIMDAFGVIVWNYGDTYDLFFELMKDYVDCRDYLYTRDFCKDCDWVSDVIYKAPLLDHDFQWREDWDQLTPEQQLEAAKGGYLYKWYEITPATCENYGTYGYLCENCGEIVFQGYSQPHGHWYYTKSSAELADMSADEQEKFLNVVGGNESSCLAPGSVTVECVYCGVRYAYGSGSETTGHTWKLIDATNNANILCGDYLSSAILAYCENCGLVAKLDSTTLPAKNYAGYIGKEDLTETQQNTLMYLLDKNGNLCVKVEDEINNAAVTLLVAAFKSTTMQTHKFVDEEKYRIYLVPGDCTTPTAYIVVCSICGLEEGKPVIKIDTKDYKDYLWTKRPTTGSTADFWDDLGYSNFNKNTDDNKSHTYALPGEDEAKLHTGHELYQGLVANYLETYKDGEYSEAFDAVKGNVRYSGFNFTKFNFLENGHDFIVTDRASCVMDPLLTLLYEDWLSGNYAWIDTLVFGNQTLTSATGSKGVPGVVKSHYYDEENDSWYTLENILMDGDLAWNKTAVSQLAWWNENKGKTFEDYEAVIDALAEGPTVEVWNALCEALGGVSNYGKNYKGISNWCSKCCTIKGSEDAVSTYFGFVLTTDHEIGYQVQDKDGVWDETHTYKLGTVAVTELPTQTEADAMVEKGEIDLQLVQYLYELGKQIAAEEVELDDDERDIYDDLVDEFKINYVLSKGGTITCVVREVCKNYKQCKYINTNVNHVMPSENNPEEAGNLANCQHADQCIACNKWWSGSYGDHELKPYNELTEEQQAIVAKFPELNKLVVEGDPTCYSGGTLKVCVYCLEASQTATWRKPESTKAESKLTALEKEGWIKDDLKAGSKANYAIEGAPDHAFTLSNAQETLEKLLDLDETTADKEAVLKEKILALFSGFNVEGDVATKTSDGSNGAKITETVEFKKISNDVKLVYTKVTEQPVVPGSGYCVGERVTSEYHLCLVCAFGKEGNVAEITKQDNQGTWTKQATGGAYSDDPTKMSALYHVYVPAKDQTAATKSDADDVVVYCVRCKTSVVELYKTLADKVKDKTVVYYPTLNAFTTAKNAPTKEPQKTQVPDIESLELDEDRCGDLPAGQGVTIVTETNSAKDALEAVVVNGGVVALADGVEASLTENIVPKKNTEIVLSENAKLTVSAAPSAIYVGANTSLKISGGVLNLSSSGDYAFGAVGEGAKLELVDTIVNASDGGVVAESGGEVVMTGTKLFVKDSMALSTNNSKVGEGVTFTVTDSVIASYTSKGNVGLLINHPNVQFSATNSTFYGICTGAWVRGGKADFKDCIFVSGSAITSNDEWGTGTYCPQGAKAALLVGGNGGSYGDATVTLQRCKSVISYEWYTEKTLNKDTGTNQNTLNTEEGDLVNVDEETGEFTYTAYDTTHEGAAKTTKSFAIAVGGTEAKTNVTFDEASATNFGITDKYLVKGTNVFYVDSAQDTQIVVQIDKTPVKINDEE